VVLECVDERQVERDWVEEGCGRLVEMIWWFQPADTGDTGNRQITINESNQWINKRPN